MKKQIFVLAASLLLLASCGGGGDSSSSISSSSGDSSSSSSESSSSSSSESISKMTYQEYKDSITTNLNCASLSVKGNTKKWHKSNATGSSSVTDFFEDYTYAYDENASLYKVSNHSSETSAIIRQTSLLKSKKVTAQTYLAQATTTDEWSIDVLEGEKTYQEKVYERLNKALLNTTFLNHSIDVLEQKLFDTMVVTEKFGYYAYTASKYSYDDGAMTANITVNFTKEKVMMGTLILMTVDDGSTTYKLGVGASISDKNATTVSLSTGLQSAFDTIEAKY